MLELQRILKPDGLIGVRDAEFAGKQWIGFKRFQLFSDNSISMDTIRICPPIT